MLMRKIKKKENSKNNKKTNKESFLTKFSVWARNIGATSIPDGGFEMILSHTAVKESRLYWS